MCGVAWHFNKKQTAPRFNIGRVFVLLAFVACFFVVPTSPNTKSLILGHPGIITFVVCFLTGLILSFRMPKKFENSFVGAFLAKSGDYSYSIYLVHFPLIVLFNYKPFSGTILEAENFNTLAYIFVSIVVSSFLMNKFIERNKSEIFKNAYFNFGLLLLIALLSFVFVLSIHQRYSQTENNIFAAWTDRSTYRCGKIFRIFHLTENICRITKIENDDKVLLLGNSHADSIKTNLAKIADKENISLYFYVQNEPLTRKAYNADKIIKEIKKHKINKVILHYNNIYLKAKHRAEMKKFIDVAVGESISLYMIAPVPTYKVHVPQEMYKNLTSGNKLSKSWLEHNRDVADFWKFSKVFREKNIPLYDPSLIFCPNKTVCDYADNDSKPYYFDRGHLTLLGAEKLNPIFMKLMADLKGD